MTYLYEGNEDAELETMWTGLLIIANIVIWGAYVVPIAIALFIK